MAVSIYNDTGALECQLWEGQLLPVQSIGDYYQRLGATGEGSQTVGYLGPDCDCTAHFLTTSVSLARQAQAIAAAWQTRYLIITDPTNKVFPRVLAKRVDASVMRGRYAHNSTTYPYRVTIRMTLAVQS